jgi:haloacid dehalogenase superfamily, subfamily IA, variant 1 with third motif having Dx(3-4)D or Dx(3-4)E
MKTTIVLDIGNVLMYDFFVESSFLKNIYKAISARKKMSYRKFFSNKEDYGFQNNKWIYSFGLEMLKEEWHNVNSYAWKDTLEKWDSLSIPIQESIEAVKRNYDKFNFVICANQPSITRKFLYKQGIFDIFSCIILDEEVGISKPNSEIFEILKSNLGELSKNCVYVGDKIDVDIIPAKKSGLKTCLYLPDRILIKSMIKNDWDEVFFDAYYSKSMDRHQLNEIDYCVINLEDLFYKLR